MREVGGAEGEVRETISWMASLSFSLCSGLLIPISRWISVSERADMMAPDLTLALQAATYLNTIRFITLLGQKYLLSSPGGHSDPELQPGYNGGTVPQSKRRPRLHRLLQELVAVGETETGKVSLSVNSSPRPNSLLLLPAVEICLASQPTNTRHAVGLDHLLVSVLLVLTH